MIRRIIIVAFVLLGIIYAAATPIFEKNDEDHHFAFARHLANNGGLPIQELGQPPTPWQQEGSQPPLYYALASVVVRFFDTSDFDLEQQPNASPIYSPYGVGNKNKLVITPEKRAFNYHGTTLAAFVLRLLGIIPGLLTILATYAIAATVSHDKRIALLAMGLSAFNPMFLTVTTAVSNDGLVIALCAVGLYILVDGVVNGWSYRQLVALGLIIAAASMTKASGVLLLPAALIAIGMRNVIAKPVPLRVQTQFTQFRTVVSQAGVVILVWLVGAGWWYVRNYNLYGDVTGVVRMAQIAGQRDITLFQALSEFTGFKMSYLAVFGQFTIPADSIVYSAWDALLILCAVGSLIGMTRVINVIRDTIARGKGVTCVTRGQQLRWVATGILALYSTVVLAGVVRWTMMTSASTGRLLFPAIAGLSTLMAMALMQFGELPSRAGRLWKKFVPAGLAVPLVVLAVISPFRYVIPAYTPPLLAQVPRNIMPAVQRMGALAELLGYRMTPSDVYPGDKVRITAVLRALSVPRDDYLLVVKLYGRDSVELARFDTYTGGGLLPSSQWHTGDMWQDDLEFTVPPTARAPAVLHVQFELYNRGSGDLVQSTSATGQAGSPLFSGSTLLPDAPVTAPVLSPLASIGDIGAVTGFSRTQALRGQPMTVTLDWRTLRQVDKDYTVYVHLLDASGKLKSQHDGQPDNGNFATSRWIAGIVFQDAHTFRLPLDLTPGPYTLVAGIYDPANGERLSVRDQNQQEQPNREVVLEHLQIR